jgi:hypothetical protein
MILSVRGAVVPYVTRDGSEIRELMHPGVHGNRAQSLAEATIGPGAEPHSGDDQSPGSPKISPLGEIH